MLDDLAVKHSDRFCVSYTVDQPPATWKHSIGHIDDVMIKVERSTLKRPIYGPDSRNYSKELSKPPPPSSTIGLRSPTIDRVPLQLQFQKIDNIDVECMAPPQVAATPEKPIRTGRFIR